MRKFWIVSLTLVAFAAFSCRIRLEESNTKAGPTGTANYKCKIHKESSDTNASPPSPTEVQVSINHETLRMTVTMGVLTYDGYPTRVMRGPVKFYNLTNPEAQRVGSTSYFLFSLMTDNPNQDNILHASATNQIKDPQHAKQREDVYVCK